MKDDHYDLIGDPVTKLSMQGAREARRQIEELQQELNETEAAARVLRRQHEAAIKVLKKYAKCQHACVNCRCTKPATDALDLLGEGY